MRIDIDHKIYSDSVISKVVYWLSGDFSVERQLDGDKEILVLSSKESKDVDGKAVHDKVFQMLNDQKLRDVIESETKDIRTILYAKAFADFDDLTEEDLIE